MLQQGMPPSGYVVASGAAWLHYAITAKASRVFGTDESAERREIEVEALWLEVASASQPLAPRRPPRSHAVFGAVVEAQRLFEKYAQNPRVAKIAGG